MTEYRKRYHEKFYNHSNYDYYNNHTGYTYNNRYNYKWRYKQRMKLGLTEEMSFFPKKTAIKIEYSR